MTETPTFLERYLAIPPNRVINRDSSWSGIAVKTKSFAWAADNGVEAIKTQPDAISMAEKKLLYIISPSG
jgi:hypothetical protein